MPPDLGAPPVTETSAHLPTTARAGAARTIVALTAAHGRMSQARPRRRVLGRLSAEKGSLKTAGVGVWRRDGMTYLVVDFFTP
ncbi:hypothetical protein BH24CHL8_BH24CHL8_03770 [soil metagenome]